MTLTLLEIVNICDNFRLTRPLPRGVAPSPYDSERFVRFQLSPDPSSPRLGTLRPTVVGHLREHNKRNSINGIAEVWEIHDDRVSFSAHLDTPPSRTLAMNDLCTLWRDSGVFPEVIGPHKWRNELYPVFADPFGPRDYKEDGSGNFMFCMERSACALFGVVTYGVHMTIYEGAEGDIKIWVPRRAKTKPTWPGYLDNTIAGGIPNGSGVFESLLKESMEEASLEESVIRKHAKAVGVISYFLRTEAGWRQPGVQYVYDLHVPPSADSTAFTPKPLDGEVESFELLPLQEVITRMRKAEFKPNTALVLIDFLIRHGLITPDSEPDYPEIMTRMHGRFDFDRW